MSTLFLVATPIGNLEDITVRATRVLGEVVLIAAEDTRQTAKLLNHLKIQKRVTSYYEHNKLDKLDCRLIRLLQKDGRMSNIAIAQELEVSEYTVRSRMKRLLDDEIIKIVAVSDPIKLGFEISGNLKIKIDLKKADMVIENLKQIDSVIWVALTTGGTDIDVDFISRSLKEFQDLIFKKISKIDGVLSTETSLMVDLVKDKHDVGTAFD